jgi:hypothetical protein
MILSELRRLLVACFEKAKSFSLARRLLDREAT